MPKNWKTTLFGVLAFLSINLDLLGVPERYSKVITGIVVAAGLGSAKDKDVTGVGATARRLGE